MLTLKPLAAAIAGILFACAGAAAADNPHTIQAMWDFEGQPSDGVERSAANVAV
jgi:hypothetical protein